jgi:hypothetical protein
MPIRRHQFDKSILWGRHARKEAWSRRSGLNGRPAVHEDQNQVIVPLSNPRLNPANQMIHQRDSPHAGLHPVALSVRGLRGKGYTNGYTFDYTGAWRRQIESDVRLHSAGLG